MNRKPRLSPLILEAIDATECARNHSFSELVARFLVVGVEARERREKAEQLYNDTKAQRLNNAER